MSFNPIIDTLTVCGSDSRFVILISHSGYFSSALRRVFYYRILGDISFESPLSMKFSLHASYHVIVDYIVSSHVESVTVDQHVFSIVESDKFLLIAESRAYIGRTTN